MAFVKETGAGLSTANSYIDEDDFNTHHADRRDDFAAGDYTDSEIQKASVLATDYIDKRFGRRFLGYRANREQALEWPRADAEDSSGWAIYSDTVPSQLKKATAEYALIILRLRPDGLAPTPQPNFNILDPDTGEATAGAAGPATSVKQVVGPIEEETKYAQPRVSASVQVPAYPEADLWLEELIESLVSRRLERG